MAGFDDPHGMGDRGWPEVRPAERISVTGRDLEGLRVEIAGWLGARAADPRFARFAGHFAVLREVTDRMLGAVEADLGRLDPGGPSGEVYERCRGVDVRVDVVRRLHGWYAAKYDQRLEERAGVALRAADEVIRSCWAEAFAAVDRAAPSGPLAYLDARFDAVATPRLSVPTDLRAPRDAVIGEFIRELPIPTVALPALCRTEPWWVVLAAHETGHHVQHDLEPELVARSGAVLAEVGDADQGACWAAWAQEVFADAFAALTVGPAAAWAVEELQHGMPARLVTMPSPARRYPPPIVRTALLGELARETGAPEPGPGAEEVARWLTSLEPSFVDPPVRAAVEAHLPLTRVAAKTLMAMRVHGVPLPEICGWTSGTFATDGPVARWRDALGATEPLVTGRSEVAAARHGVAGGVAAYRRLATHREADAGARRDRLRVTLPALLATCGPPGSLAAAPPADVDGAAARLTGRLLALSADPGSG